jgi:heme-degrading monooxygenase HmoA
MFSVIFEVKPKRGRFDEYLELAKELKPILERIDGFVDIDRLESKLQPGWILSHSTWRDEKSVIRWRTQPRHHEVQERGRGSVFEDYHLRVGEVVFDSSPSAAAPVREQRFDETEVGEAKYVTLTELMPDVDVSLPTAPEQLRSLVNLRLGAEGLSGQDLFASLYNPGKVALLASWRTRAHAEAWKPRPSPGAKQLRQLVVRIIRDYGMFDRREAPQFYPQVQV